MRKICVDCPDRPGRRGSLRGSRRPSSFFEYCTGKDKGSAVVPTDMVDGHKLATAYVYVFNAAGGRGVDCDHH